MIEPKDSDAKERSVQLAYWRSAERDLREEIVQKQQELETTQQHIHRIESGEDDECAPAP